MRLSFIRERGRRFADSRSRSEAVWDNICSCSKVGEPLGMPHSRPMSSVAAGVSEVRVRGEDGTYRAFYYTAHAGGIIVFHAFVKKTQQTPESEIEIGRKRLKEILDA